MEKKLYQLHWQSVAEPEKTEMIAQGEFGNHADLDQWVHDVLTRHKDSKPDGHAPMLCDQNSRFFWLARTSPPEGGS